MVAVGRLIGAHAALTRQLSAQLVAEHGLTLNEYEVLLLLARAPERAMRRVDLAHDVRLISVRRHTAARPPRGRRPGRQAACETDARVTYAELTTAGMAKLERCAPDQVAAAERLLGERFDEAELASLVELLGRLSALADDECRPTP